VEGEGDYILPVKDNHPTFHSEIQAAFAAAETSPTVIAHNSCNEFVKSAMLVNSGP
jgi:hypothetical protein